MAERGARPRVPAARRRLLRAARVFFTPLLPDDYLELIDPLWSSRELRGRIEAIAHETADSVTVTIRPGWVWEGHEPGQYLRVGVIVDGVHHWRAYSITSDPGRPDGFISITPKLVETGKVTPYLVRKAHAGTIVRLGGVEGTFTLPDPLPRKLLFISAGSGVTPIMSMLRDLARRGALQDVAHLHSARTPDAVIFGEQLRDAGRPARGLPAARAAHRRVRAARAGRSGPPVPRLARARDVPQRPRRRCSTRCRRTGRSTPTSRALHMERFQPVIGGDAAGGDGGAISFLASGERGARRTAARRSSSPASRPAPPSRSAAAWASATPAWGACAPAGSATCGPGRCRAREGEMVRTCINAPEGPIEIDL